MIGVAGPVLSAEFFKISGRRSLMVHVGVADGVMSIEPDFFGTSGKTPAYDLGFLIRLAPAGLYFSKYETKAWLTMGKFDGGYQAAYVDEVDGRTLPGWSFSDLQPEDALIGLVTKLYQHDIEGTFRG